MQIPRNIRLSHLTKFEGWEDMTHWGSITIDSILGGAIIFLSQQPLIRKLHITGKDGGEYCVEKIG